MPHAPFSKPRIELPGATLRPFDKALAPQVAARIAAMDPWARMSYPAAELERYLGHGDASAHKFAVLRGGETAGAVGIRHPRPKGAYLEFLAVFPEAQGAGLGGEILRWMERETAGSERNLWVVCSAFNTGALAFYERFGFERTASLPGLVADGFEEILRRKFPLGEAGSGPS